jgi:hypothetical protein
MDREQLTREILAWKLPRGYDLVEIDEPGWLASHAGGFSPIGNISDGDQYEVNIARIVHVGRHLDHDEFTAFVEAIRTWQRRTLGEYALGLAPDLIVAKFCQDQREAGSILRSVAKRRDLELVAFFGADHGRQPRHPS